MKKIIIADKSCIDDISSLRVEMQIEDWKKTLNKDYTYCSDDFYELTKKHLQCKLNKSIWFAVMYSDEKAIAMCAIEELSELPQIIVCSENNGKSCNLVSVYTKSEYRNKGYQQKLIGFLIDFARENSFTDIRLSTNSVGAVHIYEKFGFKQISNKFLLKL